MSDIERFKRDCEANIERLASDDPLHDLSTQWMLQTLRYKYVYNFTWLGLPIIQFPQDIVVLQRRAWLSKGDVLNTMTLAQFREWLERREGTSA